MIWKMNIIQQVKCVSKKKQIIRRKDGNERRRITIAKKSNVKYNITAGNKVLVKSEMYKSALEPSDVVVEE